MSLRRGFKKEAETTALEVRRELGLAPTDPLEPRRLATLLEIEVLPLAAFAQQAPGEVEHLRHLRPGEFSAVTIFDGSRALIVYNDGHTPPRQNSDITHECGHGLLHHKPGSALDEHGRRRWDAIAEEEANWIAGTILVPEPAAVALAREGIPIELAARSYGVSKPMMDWRLAVTGARIRAERRRGRSA